MFKTVCLLALLFAFSEGSPLPSQEIEGRIVGGDPTTIDNHPYQVSLRTAGNFHFCGASIISESWVLSAAHCTINSGQTSVFVIVGTSFLSRGGLRIQSSRVINHRGYTPDNLANDISLVQTSQPILIDNVNIAIIPMASHFTEAGSELVVSGWGFLQTGSNTPDQLQVLTTRAISNAECRRFVPVSFVPESKICTNVGAGRGICQGDSGGPLTEDGELVGIVSWNIPCARGSPDGFERVAYFRDWIAENSGVF